MKLQRNELKKQARQMYDFVLLHGISDHHREQGFRSIKMAYQAKLYHLKFHLKPQEIAERLGVKLNRAYDLLRKFQ